MASSELRDTDSERAKSTAVSSDSPAEAADLVGSRTAEDRARRRFPSSRIVGAAERDRMLAEVRKVDFPVGLRGYERGPVDRYVERVNRLLAELEMSSSPESAVRHALDEVSEETRDILQRAHETADEITARSRTRADDRLQQAEAEAEQMLTTARRDAGETREAAQHEAQETRDAAQREVADLRETTMHELTELRDTGARETDQVRAAAEREADELRGRARREADEMVQRAETRTRELTRNAETMWLERRRLIDDMRAVGDQLVAISDVEAKRFPHLADELRIGEDHGRDPTPATPNERATAPQEAPSS